MAKKNHIEKKIEDAIYQYKRLKIDKAFKIFNNILEEDPTNPEAHYYLGLIYSKEENWGKAVTHFKMIVDLGINYIFTQQCRMILGLIYFKYKDYDKSELEFREALKFNENQEQVYAALSAINFYKNNQSEALEFAQKACDFDPYNLNAKNTFGFLLSEYDIDIPKSIDILREVIRLKPDNPSYLDSLGWAYYKKGDYRAAISSLEEALKYSSENEEIKNHLKIVYNEYNKNKVRY